MPAKYHVKVKPILPRYFPVAKFSTIEADGCLGCVECVKRRSCVYDVYKQRRFDFGWFADRVNSWHFGLAPGIGLTVDTGQASFLGMVRFHTIVAAVGNPGELVFTFELGALFK